MSLIRGTSLQGFGELVAELGGDPLALLRSAGLDPAGVGQHDTFLPYRGVVSVLEAAATTTGAPDFGRRLAARQGLEILGPLGVAARTAASVGDALGAIQQYLSFYSPALAVSVAAASGDRLASFEWRLVVRRPPPHHQAAELGLGVALRVFRLLAGPDFLPTSVQLRHRPADGDAACGAFFGCRVETDADTYGFRFPRGVLARTLGADDDVHALVQRYLDTIVVPSRAPTAAAVARLVRPMLPTGSVDLDLVAGQLGLHRRTLQRRLAAQQESFAAVVDRVRQEEAERLLTETDMPLGQLAGVLGLSEQSALTRACRRWFGSPPREVRRAAREGAPPTEV